ncbi:GNAT family N-acetyltransferase [Portibacter marinus]|uniref:GNAT family N-acetyltransferase n=1 Tax=Portibacter marinus TaxID=2898660 RepID=UPI001F4790C5|nr:GNAT family N-acetyltransferase [Portibacter marinus]
MNYRKAKKEDMSAVHHLVQVLADYEKEGDAVNVDPKYYERCFEEKVFQVIVAEDQERIVGMVLYYMNFSTWKGKMMYLEDFVVLPEYRNQGVGSKLWEMWLKDSKAQGAKMVKWQVLDWNAEAIKFYERQGATIEKQWWNGKIIF